MTDRPISVALLAMPKVTAATLYGFHDLFAGVHRDWSMVHGGHAESPGWTLIFLPPPDSSGCHFASSNTYSCCPSRTISLRTPSFVTPPAASATTRRWLLITAQSRIATAKLPARSWTRTSTHADVFERSPLLRARLVSIVSRYAYPSNPFRNSPGSAE